MNGVVVLRSRLSGSLSTVVLRFNDLHLDTVVLTCFTCPATTVATVMLRALTGSVRGHVAASLDRLNPRPLGVRRHVVSSTCHRFVLTRRRTGVLLVLHVR